VDGVLRGEEGRDETPQLKLLNHGREQGAFPASFSMSAVLNSMWLACGSELCRL